MQELKYHFIRHFSCFYCVELQSYICNYIMTAITPKSLLIYKSLYLFFCILFILWTQIHYSEPAIHVNMQLCVTFHWMFWHFSNVYTSGGGGGGGGGREEGGGGGGGGHIWSKKAFLSNILDNGWRSPPKFYQWTFKAQQLFPLVLASSLQNISICKADIL